MTPLPGPPQPPASHAPKVMVGFVHSSSDGQLRVETPKGAQKPTQPFSTPTHSSTAVSVPPVAKTGNAKSPITDATSAGQSKQRSQSKLDPADVKAQRGIATQAANCIPGLKERVAPAHVKGPGSGFRLAPNPAPPEHDRASKRRRVEAEEVEEGELEPGEMQEESGDEEERGAPEPAGPGMP